MTFLVHSELDNLYDDLPTNQVAPVIEYILYNEIERPMMQHGITTVIPAEWMMVAIKIMATSKWCAYACWLFWCCCA
jgi:hypothetical protein